jgi:hypothetical protein
MLLDLNMWSRNMWNRSLLCLVLTSAASLCFARQPLLSLQGYGLIRFGDTVRQAERKLKQRAINDGEVIGDCRYVKFGALGDVAFMVIKNVIVRADIEHHSVYFGNNYKIARTNLNIEMGMPLTQAIKKHPFSVLEQDPWEQTGSLRLRIASPDKRKSILLHHYEGKISSMRAGFTEDVNLVEGCA